MLIIKGIRDCITSGFTVGKILSSIGFPIYDSNGARLWPFRGKIGLYGGVNVDIGFIFYISGKYFVFC